MTAATPRRLPLPGCPASLSNLAPALLPLLLGWPYRQHPSGSGWRSSAGRRPCHPMIEARRVEPWARTPDCEEYYWEGAATPWEGAATPPDHPPAPLNGGFRCAWATVSGAHGQRVEGTRVGPSSGPVVRDAPAGATAEAIGPLRPGTHRRRTPRGSMPRLHSGGRCGATRVIASASAKAILRARPPMPRDEVAEMQQQVTRLVRIPLDF